MTGSDLQNTRSPEHSYHLHAAKYFLALAQIEYLYTFLSQTDIQAREKSGCLSLRHVDRHMSVNGA